MFRHLARYHLLERMFDDRNHRLRLGGTHIEPAYRGMRLFFHGMRTGWPEIQRLDIFARRKEGETVYQFRQQCTHRMRSDEGGMGYEVITYSNSIIFPFFAIHECTPHVCGVNRANF
jgi:hypothetical protein